MTDNHNEPEIASTAPEVCKTLDIKDSTLRKYALLLKKQGYNFNHDSTGKRYYLSNDVMLLRRFINLKETGGMTLEQSAETVIKWANETGVKTPKEDPDSRYNDDIKELKETVKAQNELLKELFNRLDQQNEATNNKFEQLTKRLEERDRLRQEEFKKDLERFRIAAPEAEKEVAATTDKTEKETPAPKEKETPKKGFFSRFFRG